MKKFLAVLFVSISVPALAHGPYRPMPHRYHYHGYSYNWVAPLIIGGAVGYALNRPVPQPNPPQIVQTLPPPPLGYHYEQMLDSACNCYRWAILPD